MKEELIVNKHGRASLNGPNDVVATPDALYFTDPYYALLEKRRPADAQYADDKSELGFAGVYRYDLRTKDLEVLDSSLMRPNGIGIVNGSHLVVSDCCQGHATDCPAGEARWLVWPFRGDGYLRRGAQVKIVHRDFVKKGCSMASRSTRPRRRWWRRAPVVFVSWTWMRAKSWRRCTWGGPCRTWPSAAATRGSRRTSRCGAWSCARNGGIGDGGSPCITPPTRADRGDGVLVGSTPRVAIDARSSCVSIHGFISELRREVDRILQDVVARGDRLARRLDERLLVGLHEEGDRLARPSAPPACARGAGSRGRGRRPSARACRRCSRRRPRPDPPSPRAVPAPARGFDGDAARDRIHPKPVDLAGARPRVRN